MTMIRSSVSISDNDLNFTPPSIIIPSGIERSEPCLFLETRSFYTHCRGMHSMVWHSRTEVVIPRDQPLHPSYSTYQNLRALQQRGKALQPSQNLSRDSVSFLGEWHPTPPHWVKIAKRNGPFSATYKSCWCVFVLPFDKRHWMALMICISNFLPSPKAGSQVESTSTSRKLCSSRNLGENSD